MVEEEKKAEKGNNLVKWVTFAGICVVLFILCLALLVKENSRCVNSPFTYGANTIVDKYDDKLYTLCSCEVYTSGKSSKFYFDRDGVYGENPLLKEVN